MKDTLELLHRHPNFFYGMAYSEEAWKRPHKLTLILAQPRSGSTLLLRLLNLACLTTCIGDRPIEFYEGIVKVWKSLMEPGIYGSLEEMERFGKFPDQWRGQSNARERYLFRYYTSLLFSHAHSSGHSKTTQVGWGNKLVEPFVEMLRETYDDNENYDLRIVFLTRPDSEIAESLDRCNYWPDDPSLSHVDWKAKAVELASKQRSQFKSVWMPGDVELTYEKLCADPIGSLIKCNPIFKPDVSSVNKIIKHVISK